MNRHGLNLELRKQDVELSVAGDSSASCSNTSVMPTPSTAALTAASGAVTSSLGSTSSVKKYLLQIAIPSVYFHVAMAYAILRNNSVDLGKMDFPGTNDSVDA